SKLQNDFRYNYCRSVKIRSNCLASVGPALICTFEMDCLNCFLKNVEHFKILQPLNHLKVNVTLETDYFVFSVEIEHNGFFYGKPVRTHFNNITLSFQE